MSVEKKAWEGFSGRIWKEEVNVRDFIQNNYKPYDGDESFMAEPTKATMTLWDELQNSRKKSVQKAAFLIWRQKLFLL